MAARQVAVEYAEIASYGTLIQAAVQMGHKEIIVTLGWT
ncbi:DUF892 family protein [Tolypothrix campylonemoides VB511288]|nr:DUF892 family protein [Tolypothrix campylonemoides VB511288]